MTSPWEWNGESHRLRVPPGPVTLVEGSSFAISEANGDMRHGTADGLFMLDARFLSTFVLRIDGHVLEPLCVDAPTPFTATFFGRPTDPTGATSAVCVFRERRVGHGLLETVEIRSYARRALDLEVTFDVESDFASVFAVKERRPTHARAFQVEIGEHDLTVRARRRGRTERHDGVRIAFSEPARLSAQRAVLRCRIEPHGSWRMTVEVTGLVDGEAVPTHFASGTSIEEAVPHRRLVDWREAMPRVHSDRHELDDALARSAEDLGALRIVEPAHPEDAIVAAGAPWFMTVFGRDSIWSAYMALLADPRLALGALRTLARLQGTVVDAETEEEPGRILHELRHRVDGALGSNRSTVYYGTIDATPLFVILLGELRRWGLGEEVVRELLPAADRALAWITGYGDRDGDGFIEYERSNPHGLLNQGWKDSWDAITFADGSLAEGPIALCEVQGYAYAAFIARAHFADEADEPGLAERYRERAADLRVAFNRDFWLADRGYYAMALDGEKRPIDALASNMGHCLWSGIVDEHRAPSVAAHLVGDDLFSGWGVRTLARSMGAYNPLSYHNGSVWPHDNAIIAAGLMRYGEVNAAHRVIEGLLEVSAHYAGRMPELLSGVGRDELAVPAPFPSSCSPQAWSAAAPLLMLRTLLRWDPCVPHERLWCAPALPGSIGELRVSGLELDGVHVRVDVSRHEAAVSGLPPNIEHIPSPRPSR
jgi:glycogen debranching enzyme